MPAISEESKLSIPFVDLKAQYNVVKSEIENAIRDVLEASCFVGGDTLNKFENEFASYCGAKYALGVANGTLYNSL
jgi:dTDP-4-amino-4,6-dideoxygalactose transaminase